LWINADTGYAKFLGDLKLFASNGIGSSGFKGEFKKADIAIDFNAAGTSTNVTSVGAKITFAGAESTSTTGFVYTPDGGTTYQFRAVFGALNLASQGDATVKVEYFVIKDGNTYWSDPVTTTANAHTSRLPA
jgi:hypothetical protein